MPTTPPQLKARFDQLTSLRFFFAAMIVICHSGGLFGFFDGPTLQSLRMGVSFFFVLSGFLLAHLYPKLDTLPGILGFYRARLARIWPVHLATFVLAWWLLSPKWDDKVAAANLALVHAWSSRQDVYQSFNPPAWSLSALAFFYLLYPLLIHRFSRNWLVKVLIVGAVLAGLISYSNVAFAGSGDYSLLYVNPAARLFEFLLGICAYQLWYYQQWRYQLWTKGRPRVSRWDSVATYVELAAVVLCVLCVYYLPTMSGTQWKKWPGPAFTEWMRTSGAPMLPLVALIYVMALGRGAISRSLASRWLVFLGELSFSMFLLHQILLRYYLDNFYTFPTLPNVVAFALFAAFLLLASYVMWRGVEVPARRLLTAGGTVHGPLGEREPWTGKSVFNSKFAAATLTLAACVVSLGLVLARIKQTLPPPGSVAAKTRLAKDIARADTQDLKRLLEAGNDPNAADVEGGPSLIAAAKLGNKPQVELLLAHEANPNVRNSAGMTALATAAASGHPDVVQSLTAKGANVDALDGSGNTPLMSAAARGDTTMVAHLLSLHADPNAVRISDGYTPLIIAAVEGKTEVVKSLAAAGGHVNSSAKDGSTALLQASWNGDLGMVKLLLSLGAEANTRRPDGYTPLISASMKGNRDIVAALAAAGASVNASTSDGSTSLMHAAWRGDREMVELLLSLGADARLVNNDGYQAASLAAANGQKEIVELLAAKAKQAGPP